MVGATLSGVVLAAVMSTFLFLGRSGVNLQNYSDMEAQTRRALEMFSADVRQASSVHWTTRDHLTLRVNSQDVAYAYSALNGTFERTDAAGTRVLVTRVTRGSFAFRAFNVRGLELTLASTAELISAGVNTKQLQVTLATSRSSPTAVAASNTVLSARYILRNKKVTV